MSKVSIHVYKSYFSLSWMPIDCEVSAGQIQLQVIHLKWWWWWCFEFEVPLMTRSLRWDLDLCLIQKTGGSDDRTSDAGTPITAPWPFLLLKLTSQQLAAIKSLLVLHCSVDLYILVLWDHWACVCYSRIGRALLRRHTAVLQNLFLIINRNRGYYIHFFQWVSGFQRINFYNTF